MHVENVACGYKRKERMNNSPFRTSKRLAALTQVPHDQAETSDESDENPTDDRTENLNQHNEPDTSLNTPCIEEHEIAYVKDDEKSERQYDPFIEDEDQLVDVTIIEAEIPLVGNNCSEPSLARTDSEDSEH